MCRLVKERQVWIEEEVDIPEGPQMAVFRPYFGQVDYDPHTIVDFVCVTHGRSMADHDENEECFW